MKNRPHNTLARLLPRRSLRKLLIVSGILLLAGGLAAAAAVVEYRTNTIASHLGDWLHDTNHFRPKRGGIWERLNARASAEAGLAEHPRILFPEQGLPDAVRRARFGYRRAPEEGPAGYAVVWMEMTSAAPESRPMQDILESYRNYNIGLQIVETIDLPDTRFRARALVDAAGLLAQLSSPILDDAAADSVRTQVLEELSVDIIDRLRKQERSDLVDRYRGGEILQVELHQALGEYAGTLTLSPAPSRISFTLAAENAARILTPSTPGGPVPVR